MKKQDNLIPHMLSFAGDKGFLLKVSQFLSAISAIFILLPFIFVYFAASKIVDAFIGTYLDSGELLKWGILALVTELVGLLLYFGALLCSHTAAFNLEKNLKMEALKHLSKMPLGYFEQNPSGKLRKIIDENSAQTEKYVGHQLPDLVGAYVTMIASLILLFVFDWRIGLPLFLLFAIGFALQFLLMGKETMTYMQNYQDSLETMNHEAVEYIRGISVVKVFGQSVNSFSKFTGAIDSYSKNAMAFTMACQNGMVAFTTVINSPFLVLIPAAVIVSLFSGDMVDFTKNFLFYLIFTPACAVMLNKIMYMNNNKMQANEAMRRIDMILNAPIQEEAKEKKISKENDIVFENVTFSYENAHNPAIKNISFVAKQGSMTALVGKSGCGKSTTASLIPRFYDVDMGKITIGGVDIKDISQKDLMEKVAFVFQNPKLFKESLLDNILCGNKNATRDDALKAARLACCQDIFEKFPKGIDTVIGSEGVYLSGGEKQRIAIARAILKDAPVIVLDEATAYANPENEVLLQKAIKKLTQGKTVIVIAHRLSAITDANQILVMKEGEIVERGTHQSLLKDKKDGIYAHMWNDYMKATTWHIGNETGEGNEVKAC
ncbi:ATP-binding cassette, subfamily B [Acetitomaculum ruminis DSM 5522]|uniref:ATP-binding cassette, subfamily B n=1 Tax=Acetitomaculum ruminis DSM 5522 TaxID=1120918 RepID=A0A1I0X8B8_9FIRM|nr:ABC transporter ATP-binding protein [Acetitomaculum ruminis]SFA97094.1 ATP-binding cassette, subfamily B [Acetitomaculum ruminis DSM 5522]